MTRLICNLLMKQLQNQLNAEVSILIVVLLSIQCIIFSTAINSDQASCSIWHLLMIVRLIMQKSSLLSVAAIKFKNESVLCN